MGEWASRDETDGHYGVGGAGGHISGVPTTPYAVVGTLGLVATLVWALAATLRGLPSIMQDARLFDAGVATMAASAAAAAVLAFVLAVRAALHGASPADAIPVAVGKAALVIVVVLAVWTACALVLA